MERLIGTIRNPRSQDASAVPIGNGGHTKATLDLFSRQNLMNADRAGGRCDVPTPTRSPVGRLCSIKKVMLYSVESGTRPSFRGVALGTKRRVGFDIEDASGSKSRKGNELMIGYEAMQLRIAHRKQIKEQDKINVLQAIRLLQARTRRNE